MWNELNLSDPAHDLCEYGSKDSKILEELPELVNILTSAAEMLTEDHPIWEEIKIFKNIQAKYKRILHCDKCLQLLQRVGSCLRKMVLLNLSSVYLNLAEKIITELQSPRTVHFLPSCQQLEYVLIRTQSAAKLICESLHYTRETFCYLIQRLKIGHLVINLMMATSVTARLNIVFKSLLIQVFDFYKNIYSWRKKLRKGGWEWPKPLELPKDLEAWLNKEESDYLKPKHLPKEELDFLTSIFDENSQIEESNDVDVGNDVILLDNPTPPENPPVIAVEEHCVILEDNADIVDNGEVVARSEIEICAEEELNEPTTLQNGKSPKRKKMDEPTTLQSGRSPKKFKTVKPITLQIEDSIQLKKAQKILLKKIKNAEEMKELKVIWENLDFNSPNLLPKVLTPDIIRLIDKLFNKMKRRISQINASNMSVSSRDEEIKFLVKIARLKFAKYLGLLQNKQETNVNNKIVLKPAKTFKELRILYETIYHKLQAAQRYKKCAKLKKSFKSAKADIRLLVDNEEKASAKKLICDTSKMFLSKFL